MDLEMIKTILQTLADFGFSPLNIVLIVMIYLLMAHVGIAPSFWTKTKKQQEKAEHVPAWAKKLLAHYNDETTDKLTSIEKTTNAIKKDTDKIIGKHDEWERHGVPIKKTL